MSEEFTQDVYIDGKLVICKQFIKSKITAKGIIWEGSWEQACQRVYHRKWYSNNKTYVSEYGKQYRTLSQESRNKRNRDYYHKNKEKLLLAHKEYRQNNKTKDRNRILRWNEANKERVAIVKSKYQKTKVEQCHRFRFIRNIRINILQSFKRSAKFDAYKSARTHDILGCTIPDLLTHITRQFTDGMTLDNHGIGTGKWVLDHIIPIKAAQDLATSDEEFQRMVVILNHHTNLRPMWWTENGEKSDKYDIVVAEQLLH